MGGVDRIEQQAGLLANRALIGLLTFTFARVSAAVGMKVEDYYSRGKRWRVRLHEKNGKIIDAACHHKLEGYLDEYLQAAGIANEKSGPLFRAARGRSMPGSWSGAAPKTPASADALAAGHASSKTTALYDRRDDEISVEEVEGIAI
jgi:integrase/recombinase XerD